MSEEMNFDAAFALDDEMQQAIDRDKIDEWALKPDRKGVKPKGLVQDAHKEQRDEESDEDFAKALENFNAGFREVWYQDERCKITSAEMSPWKDRDTQALKGAIVEVVYEAQNGPNQGKEVNQIWFIQNGDTKAAQRMNRELGEIFDALKIERELTEKNGRQVPSNTATLPRLKDRQVNIRLMQKWDHPWKPDGQGGFDHLTDLPKKFSIKVKGVKAA